jgi:nitrite reductase/ring-hydroxylating ferredoxin subunit
MDSLDVAENGLLTAMCSPVPMADSDPPTSLHPVAALSDLQPRHVFHGRLFGQELAIWRADDGFINVWENRCVHRGVRLSTGVSDGAELMCQYHGWQYSNRSGACSYIPAHPGDAPVRAIAAATFTAKSAYGLVWTGSDPADVPQPRPELDASFTNLRSLPVSAPAAFIVEALQNYRFELGDEPLTSMTANDDPWSVVHSAGDGQAPVICFVQPADADRAVIRPILGAHVAGPDRMAILRRHAAELERFRTEVESDVSAGTVVPLPSLRARPPEMSTAAKDPGRTSVRSDRTATAYRRWLYDMGWTYGVIRD